MIRPAFRAADPGAADAGFVAGLAEAAVRALLEEAELTPRWWMAGVAACIPI
jgi:hypothetical protein